MTINTLHQFIVGAAPGDAITDHALLIRRWLRELGFASNLYAYHIHEAIEDEVRPMTTLRAGNEGGWLIAHHSIGSPAIDRLLARRFQLILIYHNITPAEFFAPVDPAWANFMRMGQKQLQQFPPQTRLALAVSPYNRLDLQQLPFNQTGVLPLALDERLYQTPSNQALVAEFNGRGPILLFVGRIAPNKRQEDLIKLLFYYRRIEPEARLVLVGDRWQLGYDRWLEGMAHSLGLAEAVTLTGRVSQVDMVTYYRTADLFVSMSEHEGFGKPLIESMYLDLPVLAYRSTGIPYTLGEAGIMFKEKDYESLAELVDMLINDKSLRNRLLKKQEERVKGFLEPQVKAQLQAYLEQLGLMSQYKYFATYPQ
jgi:glycosyltransferase involved in cell wall biosynthesis